MARSQAGPSPLLEDVGETATQLLNQFRESAQGKDPSRTAPTTPQVDKEVSTAMPLSIEVVVPEVHNPHDYDFLPGHFSVHSILGIESDNPRKTYYKVKLDSGEHATIPYALLMHLKNGTQALDSFNPDSDSSDDLMTIDREHPRRRIPAFDGPASDWSGSRGTRSRHGAQAGRYTKFFEASESEKGDDIGDISSDELNEPFTVKRRPRRGIGRPSHASRKSSSDDYTSNNPSTDWIRSSGRNRKSRRQNLQERLESDVSEAESAASKQQKYVGAKEVFHKLPHGNEFRRRHFGCCAACNYYEDDPHDKGVLVFCQGCTSAYHQACLGPRSSREHLVTKVNEGNFVLQCRRCIGVAHAKHDLSAHLGYCVGCREKGPMSEPLKVRLTAKQEQVQRISNGGTDPITEVDMAQINNVDNVLFRCSGCQRAFHSEHLPPVSDKDSSTDLFSHYSRHWHCKDCSDTSAEIGEIVAWHPVDVDPSSSVPLQAELFPDTKKEYLIKWKQKSYFRCTWMPGDWVTGVSNPATRAAFYKSPRSWKPTSTFEEAVEEDKLRVDIVFDVAYRDGADESKANLEMVEEAYVKYKGLGYEDSVWESPPDPSDTARWEDFKTAFEDWAHRDDIMPPDRSELQTRLEKARRMDFANDLLLETQPEIVTGGELMEYQLEGVNWLYYKFIRQQNAILADDMGLGKTIQVIGFIATLMEKHQCWPFLVVAPNATVPNWRREIKMWAPSMRVVTFFGSAFSRQMANDYEMFPEHDNNLRCHVVIASYESMIDSDTKTVLSKVRWAGLIVDEGQRLKNDESQLYDRLRRMKFDFKALLTGTPLQNNIRELFNLIQFLDPNKKASDLEKEYGELNSANIRTLHEMIRPFFLRRTKAEALPFLPPMLQIILPVTMSVVQKKLYKSILGKNPKLIQAICKKKTGHLKKTERHNLNNILVQLRKCLCHPFIYNKDIEEQTHDPVMAFNNLVEASGKLQLLRMMLPKLRERGHRVLLFSQFLENLNIVEDFLTGLDIKYCRIDGGIAASQKQQQIDQFNAPNSPFFVFLLSTRSGGVGINLATADTVIIMDPDFNPKQDMQALSRAHRIGQKNTVLVFHLTTRGSVEEKIMQKGKKKLALDHVLIERMEDDEDEEGLESILQHGAQALFDGDDSADTHYDSESIDKFLDRSHMEQLDHQSPKSTLSSTGQPQFNFARVWQNDRGTLEEVTETEDSPLDTTVWEKILHEREMDAIEEAHRNAEGFGRGKRKRATVNYGVLHEELNELDGGSSPMRPSPAKLRKTGDIDGEFQRGQDTSSDTESDDAHDRMDIRDPAPLGVIPPPSVPPPSVPPRTVPSPASPLGAVPPSFMPPRDVLPPTRPLGAVPPTSVSPESVPPQSKVRPFRRVNLPPPQSSDGTTESSKRCIMCDQSHAIGYCPLKEIGPEHCGLCGLAHFGRNRICPHLKSQVQVQRMLEALKLSNEPQELKDAAQKYLKRLLGHLAIEKRREAEGAARLATRASNPTPAISNPQIPAPQAPAPASRADNFVDLT
ncbi:hypothetical protein N7492_005526 [Penicillium capsulatum]|uniref:Chromatin remodeling complex subunit n=1 Tax=Penicillium capsulatum TaxID=69766 RepID=A0A9W9IC21_9EURO|nr:hypothetical protein N7492_005526 [Penicillium capsulatum]KAJ6135373.1 hypothetical protein N7512_000533 [Penicillium capsulatum]